MGEKIARLLNRIGIVAMVLILLGCIPFTVPKWLGFRLYEVQTGSMEPEYPIGGLVYVREVQPEEIEVGDVITYQLGTDTELVMTHRVVSVDRDAQTWVTKGDQNETEDVEPVAFKRLIGKSVYCIPRIAFLADFLHSAKGIAAIVGVFGLVLCMWLIADRLRKGKLLVSYVVGLAFILVSVVSLTAILMEYKIEGDQNQSLRDKYVTDNTGEKTEQSTAASPQQTTETAWYDAMSPDVEGLQELNEDVIGWIHFDNNEYIDYPILYSGEDDTYLHTDIYGNASKSGCIFLEGNNNPDLLDCHSILYGHNMKDLSMFGSLKKYKTDDYYQDNAYFTVYLEDVAYRYQIFAWYDVDETDDVYTVGFAPDEQFAQFISKMYRKSYEDTGITVTKDDRVLTLSTCSTTGMRFVVHAVCVAQHSYEQ